MEDSESEQPEISKAELEKQANEKAAKEAAKDLDIFYGDEDEKEKSAKEAEETSTVSIASKQDTLNNLLSHKSIR